ncbi:tRNA (adenosine(37)-N6)-threonylcarbamoyltransferase complex ATPase subunit type 1 TsaE [Arthrobacter sp. MYb227]|uniref:tRNA (adenosine(37)-N6)-threonylcarbamoyltransferase complex ATPase subunit type 1 TsaE n=1 Tax=Arthrobacter sp. MYb227 TaxID=1848601 RepID=UPI000CFCC86A|nr:tRNA (adenosine(37)-N6)-threonylcarbamoyltransferase complex ATPase subunit type 1 TsaE [Arthrobacter sp. MYb227]PQZ96469.1 tRNA (adenosine(37)-N6)-threonylcarbamoyltransferase complex ATPase subunit type 1 TsaE [Arthrobacter sp. MYb227]
MAEAMFETHISVTNVDETQGFAQRLGKLLERGDLLILSGELGAGKTTFTQGLGAGIGVREGIISPTFVLSRIHPTLASGPNLVHVDAYRLTSAAEVDDLDLEATMSTSVTVVEWGNGKVEQLNDSRLEVTLLRAGSVDLDHELVFDFHEGEDEEPRTIKLEAFGPRWAKDEQLISLLNEFESTRK